MFCSFQGKMKFACDLHLKDLRQVFKSTSLHRVLENKKPAIT